RRGRGTGRWGTGRPPAGTTPWCLQFASPAPMSIWVTTPSGKGKGAKVATCSVPSVWQVPPAGQPLSSKHVVVVALLQCPVLWVVTRCAAQHNGRVVLVVVMRVVVVVVLAMVVVLARVVVVAGTLVVTGRVVVVVAPMVVVAGRVVV